MPERGLRGSHQLQNHCPKPVLRYLGRYTHRVAISNHRLISFDGEQVMFRWKDYGRGNKQRLMTLSASEFLRRYVQHVLPHGFVLIRQFGFLANRHRSKSIAAIRHLLASDAPLQEPSLINGGYHPARVGPTALASSA